MIDGKQGLSVAAFIDYGLSKKIRFKMDEV